MSQQINLLQRRGQPNRPALAAAAVLLFALLGLLAYGAVLQRQLGALQHQLADGAGDVRQAKAALVARGAQSASDPAAASNQAEIEALQARLLLAQQMGALAGNDSLGNPAGYLPHFATLSSVSEKNLWLTSILISDGGTVVHLAGRALRSESVLGYAAKVNRAFSAQGVHFESVEMTPEDSTRSDALGKPLLGSVGFKLF
jgi:hypothetical protein